MLTQQHIETFLNDGVVVVENVFTDAEVSAIREAFHKHNRDKYGVDHCKLLDGDKEVLACVKGPRIKSPISNTFYPAWKLLEVNTADRVWQLNSQLWAQTYAVNAEHFTHPFGNFDHRRGYLFIDRVCYRLPDTIRAEGGLAPHLDRNPYDPYLMRSAASRLTKWRPIQGFVSLTDQYGGDSGGLRCVRGFHREIDEYFRVDDDGEKAGEEGGEFYRLQHNKHRRLYERCQPVDCAAGSVVLWDNRIVHSTAEKLNSFDTREVLYTSFLPAGVPCNDAYAREQWAGICTNHVPPAFKDHLTQGADQTSADRDWELASLTDVQAMLLGRQ